MSVIVDIRASRLDFDIAFERAGPILQEEMVSVGREFMDNIAAAVYGMPKAMLKVRK